VVFFNSNRFGMLKSCALRDGNVHSAYGWRAVLDPFIACYSKRDLGGRIFRTHATYAILVIHRRLAEAGCFYFIRLPQRGAQGQDCASTDPARGTACADQGQTLL